MSIIQQAVSLNSQGVSYLASRQERKAMNCFKQALSVMSSACNGERLHTGAAHLMSGISLQRSEPIALPNTMAQHKNMPSMSNSTTTPSNGHFSHAFVIAQVNEDDTYETGSLFSAIIIHNYALALHRRGDEVSLQRASVLYDHSLELLSAISDSFDSHQVQPVVMAGLENMGDIFYKMGDYAGLRNVLDSIFQLNLKYNLVMEEQEGMSSRAPAA